MSLGYRDLHLFCADVGSVSSGNFGWSQIYPHSGWVTADDSIEHLADAVAATLNHGVKVALGFECPLFVPSGRCPEDLTRARAGEGNRAWSAGAGAGALATGLVQVEWVLSDVRRRLSEPGEAFLDWTGFQESANGLFLWEAFVSGRAKANRGPRGHAEDADLANRAFRLALPDPTAANAVDESECSSLVGAAILRTGWSTDLRFLRQPALVIKAAPISFKRVGDLFAERPDHWGLRGDPHLWFEMEKFLSREEMPASSKYLASMLETAFAHLTGRPLGAEEMTFVEDFDKGGMSSGWVDHGHWSGTLMPLLLGRYRRSVGGVVDRLP